MSDKNRGLYIKYEVQRLDDAAGKHNDCDFYVLDLVHDKFSKEALTAYANACESEYPELAKDIRNRI